MKATTPQWHKKERHSQSKASWLSALLLITSLPAFLSSCASISGSSEAKVNCQAFQSSCHHGRFGLVWKTDKGDGKLEGDSISGSYEWRSGRFGPANETEMALLEVNSTLGPTIGIAKRVGQMYEVRAADGRVYLAKDWQSLFDLMFPVQLPADALINWMKNPGASNLPDLPDNLRWEVDGNKYRVHFSQGNTSGRVDLLPQGKLDR